MTDIRQIKDFDEFPFEKQCEIVKNSPFAEKAELILSSQYPETIIDELGPENFYIIARSADKELLPELISFANTDQLLFYTDFQCFDNDRVNSKKFTKWIQYLLEASPEKFLEWTQEMDFDFIVSGYKKIMRIIKSTPEEVMDEVLEDEEYFSIDFLYYICIKDTDDFRTIKQSIEFIFEHDKAFYINILECVIAEITQETEEEAFRNRIERLSEVGFPDKDASMKIYELMTRDEWINLEKKTEHDISLQIKNEFLLKNTDFLNPIIHNSNKLFIDDVLSYIAEKSLDLKGELDTEIMSITNKVLCLSMEGNHDLDEDHLKRSLREVKGMLNIALILLAGKDVRKSASLLSHYWLEHIFRRGFTEIAAFRKRVHAMVKKLQPVDMEILFNFFDNQHECTLRGILNLSPKFFDESVTSNLYNLREFRTQEDIEITKVRLKTIENIFQIFFRIEDLDELFGNRVKLNMPVKEISSSSVVFTAFANYSLKQTFSAYPLNKMKLLEFFEMAFKNTNGHNNTIKPVIKKNFYDFIEKTFPEAEDTVIPFIKKCFSAAEEELKEIDLANLPDHRYIRSLCFVK